MKFMKTIGLVVLLLAGSALAGSKLILDESHGLTEKTEIQSYDGETQTVKVKTATGIVSPPLSSFPDAAQKEILAWVADKEFKSSSGLRIKIEEMSAERPTGDMVWYSIALENRSEVELCGIQMESRTFYELEKDDGEDKRCVANHFETDIPAGEERVFTSQRVFMRDCDKQIQTMDRVDTGGGGYTYEPGHKIVHIEDKLWGMHLLVTKQGHDGGTLSREAKDGRVPGSNIDDFVKFSESEEAVEVAKKARIRTERAVKAS